MSRYPSIEDLYNKKKGKVLLRVHRSYRSILSNMLLFMVSALIFVIISVAFHGTPYIRLLAIVPILFLLDVFRLYYDDVVHFERHKMTYYFGRLSLKYEIPSIKYQDIRGISVNQDIFGRILDYGNVNLSTAGTEGFEIVLRGVRTPKELAQLINELRNASIKEQLQAPGAKEVQAVKTNNE